METSLDLDYKPLCKVNICKVEKGYTQFLTREYEDIPEAVRYACDTLRDSKNFSTLNVRFYVSGGIYSQIIFAEAEQKIYVKGDMYVEAKPQSTNFFPWPITLPQHTPIEEAPATILAASLSFTRQCKAILCKIAQEREKQKNMSPQEIVDLVIEDMKQSKWF